MGGVPFKSSGCNTCRRRKVKCDETKPACTRCVKNGHVCTGYERERVFIHTSSSTIDDGSQKLVRRARKTAGDANHNGLCQLGRVEPKIPGLDASVEVRSQLFQSFIDWYLPSSEYIQDTTGKNTFLQTIPDLVTSSRLLDKAVTSLSSAFLARQNKDSRLLEYSTKLYGNAILLLNGKIKSGANLGHDVLYSTVIFQLYELINCSPPGFSAWIAHVKGSSAIMNQCAGRKGETAAEKLFHRQFKFVTLCDAIGKRKAAGLYNSLAWEPDSFQGTRKPDPVDEILDKLVECSALMEQVDHFVQYGDEQSDKIRNIGEELLSSCLALETQFHEICAAMQYKLGLPSRLPPDNKYWEGFRSTLSTKVFLEPLNFPSMTCAESHILYWASLILLYPLIDQLLSVLDHPSDSIDLHRAYTPSDIQEEHFESPGPETSPDFTALAEHYANEICRSVMYCIQPDMKTLGAQMLLAPLSQSAQFFYVRDLTDKYRWCQNVFTVMPQLGLGIGIFLKDMVWPKYCDSHGVKSCYSSPPSGTRSSSRN